MARGGEPPVEGTEGTVNRDKLEQEAIAFLQRGQADKALDRYLTILRHEPTDRRIRQRVAEVNLTLGRKAEGLRQLAEVAQELASSGQERAAVSLYKQLLELQPDHHQTLAHLASCYQVIGRRSEARETWEEAFRLAESRDSEAAITYARAIARLAPGEVPVQVRVAELLEAGGRKDEAFDAWVAVGTEARRFGRADDQARFLERALKLRPSDMDALLSAAEARVVQGEMKPALAHLQRAFGQDPRNVVMLTLLGRALQKLGELEKARRVWVEAARRHAEEHDRDAQVEALRCALECGADDPELTSELERVDAEARRYRVRLDERAWAEPQEEAEIRCIVQARTLRRYGFPERAREVLEAADAAVRESLAWKVHMAELLAAGGDYAAAVAVLEQVHPSDPVAQGELHDRLEILAAATPDPDSPLPQDSSDAEELIDDERTAGDAASPLAGPGDRPDADESGDFRRFPVGDAGGAGDAGDAGDRDAGDAGAEGSAPAAPVDGVQAEIAQLRTQLAEDPSNHEVLLRLAALMSEGPGAESASGLPFGQPGSFSLDLPEPDVDDEPAFGDVDPEALGAVEDRVALARAYVSIGMFEEALDQLHGQEDVEAQVVQALAALGLGRSGFAQKRLERAVQAGNKHHPAYVEALWELAGLYLLRKKIGNAERLLDELAALDPAWRPTDLAARRRGIELLRAR